MSSEPSTIEIPRRSPLPFTGVSKRHRSFFYTQVARMLSVGISPARTLTTLAGQRGSRRLSRAATDMAARVESGARLAEAFARHPNIFPTNEVRMIEASEYGGKAPETMLRIARFLDTLRTFWLRVVTGLIYPAILLLVAIVFIPLLIAFFVGDPVKVLRVQLISAATTAGVLLAAVIAWRSFSSLSAARVLIDGFVLHIPIFGGLARKLALARFADTMEALYSAGVHVPEALARAGMACGNASIARRIVDCVPLVQAGTPLSEALAQSGAMPFLALNLLEVGEVSGTLDDALRKFAENEHEDLVFAIDRLAKILPNVIYALVVLFVVLQIAGMLRSIAQLYGSALR
jgi:type II secretory pathway component PulF